MAGLRGYNRLVNTPTLLQVTDAGLYCPAGRFHIDPWRPVEFAVVTHGHSDHARWGSRNYLAVRDGLPVYRARLGENAAIRSVEYGEGMTINGVTVSLHPAGHILGSAQVRVEHRGEVWVVSGDYKLEADPTCAAFEPVRCHTFITESTFGLPIYRWPASADVFGQINAWWRGNQEAGRASLLFGYALGKSQRLLAGIDNTIGPIFTHGAVEKLNAAYRDAGVQLPGTTPVSAAPKRGPWDPALVLAPTSALGTPWMRKFGDVSTGYLSGWMQIRGTRRRKAVDRGFVLSDHADWPGLLTAINETGATRVLATHGYTNVLARWLTAHGVEAGVLQTRFEGEREDGEAAEPAA